LRLAGFIVAAAVAGCEWNTISPPDAAEQADARHLTGDAMPDAAPANAPHLLLTEVALAGTEFIEIANPTAQPVDLTNYYVSDNGNYFTLPVGPPVLGAGDFVARFPTGKSIAAGGVITIAIGTAVAFNTAYGSPPTYSIKDHTMVTVYSSGTISLTDGGEIIALFAWDGSADLVSDVDLVLAGAGAAGANGLVSKSGLGQGASNYAPDANTIAPQAASPGVGKSTKRIAAEAGNETQDGTGNGITGHDETSEDTSVTWDSAFSAPTPGSVPPGL
jgi:uncharacterized protein